MSEFRDLGRPGATPADEQATLRAYLEQFRDLPFLNGALVTATVKAGQQSATVRHGLKRSFTGAVSWGSSTGVASGTTTPEATAEPASSLIVTLAAVAGVDTTVKLWVF